MKKLFFALVCAVLALNVGRAVETSGQFDTLGVYYNILTDSTCEVVSGGAGNKYTGNVTIPVEIQHAGKIYTITRIADEAFMDCKDLTGVMTSFQAKIEEIGARAFKNSGLTSISVRPSVKVLGDEAYAGCASAKTISFGSGALETIGDSAFAGCVLVKEVTIPMKVTSIGINPFLGCENMIRIKVQNTNTSYRSVDGVLLTYDYKTLITFPLGSALESFNVPKGCQTIQANAFANAKLKEIATPHSLKTIEENAFSACENLESIKLGKSLATVEAGAFANAKKITKVYAYGETPATGAAFDEAVYTNATLYVSKKEGVEAAYKAAEGWKEFANVNATWEDKPYDFLVDGIYYKIDAEENNACQVVPAQEGASYEQVGVVIPNRVEGNGGFYEVTSIAAKTFENNADLRSINLPASLKAIGTEAFKGCPKIENVRVYAQNAPALSVTQIDGRDTIVIFDSVVYEQAALNVPKGYKPNYVVSEGWKRFKNITDFEVVKADFVVDGIAYKKMSGDTCVVEQNIEGYFGKVVIPETVAYEGVTYKVAGVNDNAFANCAQLVEVVFPESEAFTKIGRGAFINCTDLQTLIMPDNVTEIGVSAFHNCLYLGWSKQESQYKEIKLSKNLKEIPDFAFYSCKSLSELHVPEGVTRIGNSAFAWTGLFTIILPQSLTEIGSDAFSYAGLLSEIEIPEGVKEIKNKTFFDCEGLQRVKLPESLEEIGLLAFAACRSLTEVTIPAKVAKVGSSVFSLCLGLESVYCLREEPAEAATDICDAETYQFATLYVPEGCKAKYEEAEVWKKFLNIEEIGSEATVPTDLSVSNITKESAKLSWKGNAVKYVVKVERKEGEEWKNVILSNSETSAKNYNLEKLTAATTYRFSVKSIIGDKESEYSEPVEFTTLSGESANEGMRQISVSIYPNPSNGMLTIDLAERAKIEIYSLKGQCLQTMELAQGKHPVNIANSGIYFVKIMAKATKTVVVERVIVR